MMWGSVLMVFAATLVSGYTVIDNREPTGLVWPTEYYFRGNKVDLSVSLETTFEIWYSAALNRSRVSYYNRMDSTYYYGATDDFYGYIYKVYPTTSEDLEETEECSSDIVVTEAEDFLPSVEDYTYNGQRTFMKKIVSIWVKEKRNENGTEQEVLYVYRDDTDGWDIPVRHEFKKYSEWTKALEDHWITEYYAFKPPDVEELDITNGNIISSLYLYYAFKPPDVEELDITNVAACEDKYVGSNLKKALQFYHPDSKIGLNKTFHVYKQHHKRGYYDKEHEMRKQIFQRNWRQVIAHNKKNLSYKMAINQFSDRTPDELRHLTATRPHPHGRGSTPFPYTSKQLKSMAKHLPKNYNMKLDGFISRVKNQGTCGSCWAFATVAALEGAVARADGDRRVALSVQSLVDCAWGFHNYGCDGGMLDSALTYVLEYGIPSDRQYGAYLGQDGNCTIAEIPEVTKIKGFSRVPPRSSNAMKVALHKFGPVAVAIYASDNLIKYSSGIFYDTECEDTAFINHGVTVVGYGVQDDTLYWIVKNSWGEEWGQDGYVLMSATNDNCLTLTEAYYPIV